MSNKQTSRSGAGTKVHLSRGDRGVAQRSLACHSSLVTRHLSLAWFTLALLVSLFSPLPIRAADAQKPTLESIGNKVMCVCGGCVTPLNECPMVDCAEKAQERAFIQQEIAAGKDEAAILQDVSARYGLHALAAPPAKGFNLTVWILPAIGLLIGLAIVVAIVRRWYHKRDTAPAGAPASLDPKVVAAVEEEMKSTGMGK